MAIVSVTSSSNAYAGNTAQADARQVQQQRQSAEVTQTAAREARTREDRKESERATQPVRNAQGQVTGSLINVVA